MKQDPWTGLWVPLNTPEPPPFPPRLNVDDTRPPTRIDADLGDTSGMDRTSGGCWAPRPMAKKGKHQ